MNIVFDFGNVLVRWEPERVYVPYFGDDARYWYFWRHICDADFRNRIDAGNDMAASIAKQQTLYPDYAEALSMYQTKWEEALPGEMPGMYDLVSQLIATPGINVYGLTNWSMETFPTARKRFPILQLINNYVVSGQEGVVKPDPAIFRILINRFGLSESDTLFIDDNPANVAAAVSLGMKGIVFTGAESLRKDLKLD